MDLRLTTAEALVPRGEPAPARSSVTGTAAASPVFPEARAADHLQATRTLLARLPLGKAPAPLLGRSHLSWTSARRDLEVALVQLAMSHGVALAIDGSPTGLARQLAQARVVRPDAALAAIVLVPLLRAGEEGRIADEGGWIELDSARLAARLAGHLRSRMIHRRAWWPPAWVASRQARRVARKTGIWRSVLSWYWA